jgi:hypothetical protein
VSDISVTRSGGKLELKVQSGIGYFLTFSHDCVGEANAEAWLRHVQAFYAKQDTFAENKQYHEDSTKRELEHEIRRLKRRVSHLKRKAACVKHSPSSS